MFTSRRDRRFRFLLSLAQFVPATQPRTSHLGDNPEVPSLAHSYAEVAVGQKPSGSSAASFKIFYDSLRIIIRSMPSYSLWGTQSALCQCILASKAFTCYPASHIHPTVTHPRSSDQRSLLTIANSPSAHWLRLQHRWHVKVHDEASHDIAINFHMLLTC